VTAAGARPAGGRPVVWFHIGAPKTGTTFLQRILHEHRGGLRDAGLLYPGTAPSHFWASQDLRRAGFRGHHDPHVPGAWRRTVEDIRAWNGPAVISHESFGRAGPQRIDRGLADLDFAEVHIVLTARDLARQLPAVWQERVKNRSTESFGEFLASVRADRDDAGPEARAFWDSHGIVRVLARWSRHLPPERVHVVTVPPAGTDPALLWHRFAGLLGLGSATEHAVDPAGQVVNTSLGAAEVAVLRAFNEAIEPLDVPWPAYAAVFKQTLAPQLGARRGPRIAVPPDVREWTVQWSRDAVQRLRQAGYSVVGDLGELIPAGPAADAGGTDPDAAPAEDRAGAALDAMVGLAALVLDGPTAAAAVRRAQRGAVARRAEELARRSDAAAKLRNVYRRLHGEPVADEPLP
jgi:hypothetical protein